MGIRDLLQRMGSGTRNTIQRIPGGSEAFPLERNGTVNWMGNPFRGDNVLGSMVRGMTGIGAADDVLGAFRGGNSAPSAGMNPINVIPPSGRSGSVVAQGFVGRPSGIGGVSQRPSRPSRSEALGIGQAPIQIVRNDPEVNGRMDVDSLDGISSGRGGPTLGNNQPPTSSANRQTPMRDGRGGYNGRSWASARGVGQGMRRTNEQALQEVMEQMERWRNRGGLLQER